MQMIKFSLKENFSLPLTPENLPYWLLAASNDSNIEVYLGGQLYTPVTE